MGSYKKIGLSHEMGLIDIPPLHSPQIATLTLLHSERSKLHKVLAILSAIRLKMPCFSVREETGHLLDEHSIQVYIPIKPCTHLP